MLPTDGVKRKEANRGSSSCCTCSIYVLVRLSTYVSDVCGWLCDRSPAAVFHQSIKRIEKEKGEEQKMAPSSVPAFSFKQKQSED